MKKYYVNVYRNRGFVSLNDLAIIIKDVSEDPSICPGRLLDTFAEADHWCSKDADGGTEATYSIECLYKYGAVTTHDELLYDIAIATTNSHKPEYQERYVLRFISFDQLTQAFGRDAKKLLCE